MGRRRRRAAKVSRAKPKLDTQFDCPYCGTNSSVEVKMNRPEQLGELKCRVCGVQYQTRINYLNEPVDIYSEWIDEAAERQKIIDKQKREGKPVNLGEGGIGGPSSSSANPNGGGATTANQGANSASVVRSRGGASFAANLDDLVDDDGDLKDLIGGDSPLNADEFDDDPF